LGSGISLALDVREVPLVIKDRWCSCRFGSVDLIGRRHAELAPMIAGLPAQMAHPKGLMTPGRTRGIRANRTPFVWTDVIEPVFRCIRIVLELNRATQY